MKLLPVACVIAVAGTTALDGFASGATQPLLGSLAAVARPARAGATPVALTLAARLELQCGQPGPGPIVVRLPAALRLGQAMPRAAVLVDGRSVESVRVSGHVVTLVPRRHAGVICDVIGPGTLTVLFTKSARLGNPVRPGSYPVSLTARGQGAAGKLAIS